VLRGSAVAGAGGEALRRAEMREQKCTLNLPIVIGQTLPSQSPIRVQAAPNRGAKQSLWQEAGYRCFHWTAHIQPFFSQWCQRPSDRLRIWTSTWAVPGVGPVVALTFRVTIQTPAVQQVY